MTPDRPDQTPDDAQQHGVLSDTGSIETAGLGILGSATERVTVDLSSGSEDDFTDDDVIGDEVPFQIEAEIPTDTAEGEIVEVSAFDQHDSHHNGGFGGHDVQDAELVDELKETGDRGHAPAAASARDSASTYDAMIAGAVAAAVAEPEAITDSVPATRREAYHPDPLERVHAVERVHPHSEVALTSKRLGEFEIDRETADLLTADRLLDPHQVVRPEPEGAWQHFLYSISGHRINLGDGKRARARKELDRRIAAPLNGGARFVPVLSRKGGVGKTTVTTLLGMALADARDDRIIAVDANPDRGTLAERIARSSGKTVRDLVRARAEVVGFNDLSSIVARDETRLDVLASDADPRVSEAFSDRDYLDVASLAAHYYSIVLTDTGTGIVHSVMGATLDLADQLVIVSGLSVDEARLASETLTWLEINGYAEHVRSAVVVLNAARPGAPLVRLEELESHFRTRVRNVVRIPYDPHIAAGSAIAFNDLQPGTRLAARELAASVVERVFGRSLAQRRSPMAVRTIRVFGDPVLKTVSLPIDHIDDGVRALVRDLVDTVEVPGRAGVAAPQIGIGLRAFSYNIDGDIGYVLNPVLVEVSGDPVPVGEGCLSVPGLWHDALRHPRAKVVGIDLDGNEVVIEGEGLLAQALQHETDHLEGTLFLDRLAPETRRVAMREVRESAWF